MARNRMMGVVAALLVACAGSRCLAGPAAALVPQPKSVSWSTEPPVVLGDSTAIVLGEKASEPAKCAADLLQRQVAKRFGRTWPVLTEKDDWKKHSVVVLMGERNTHRQVERFCAERKIDLGPASPGADGYVIDVFDAEGRTVALVAGSDARGTLYGQDTLFQLLRKDGDRLALTRATIRDWPTVPWRGRPQTSVSHHLQPGIMDLYATSRVNFIDLRNGTYAFEPEYKFTDKDRKEIDETIREAHRRGIIVFGTVNCGVVAGRYGAVADMFRQFLAFGVDGLWISFDDKGPGDSPETVTSQTLKLARGKGIRGNRIAITPPKSSYQIIRTDFNRKIMAIAGMEEALWFWTPVPSERELAEGRAIGLKTKLSWWHNWPRPECGFTHAHGGSMRGEGKRAYMEVPPMAIGWHGPDYALLAAGGPHLQAVMPWGGNAWDQWYITPVICWWGWSPEQTDWDTVRGRVYDAVFGPSAVAEAKAFDDALVEAKKLFAFTMRGSRWRPQCPPRLKNTADRPKATAMLAKMEELFGRIEAKAASGTMLDGERLRKNLLDPMRAEAQVGKAAAALDYAEYSWDATQRQILDAVYDDDLARADAAAAKARQGVVAAAEKVRQALPILNYAGAYADWWTARAKLDGKGWRDLIEERRAELKKRIAHYDYYSVVIGNLLKDLDNVPYGWGRGGATRQLRVIATAMPDEREQQWGTWLGGRYENRTAVFLQDGESTACAGDYCELGVKLPVSGHRERLGLLVFMNRWTKDSLGLEHVKRRWAGYASVQLLWGERVMWTADIGLPRDGQEWDLVRMPAVPETLKELPLRLRVVSHKDSDGVQPIVLVGPVRLVELPE